MGNFLLQKTHGLFYTAKIDRFWFVYDCGSSSVKTIKTKVQNFCKTHLNQKRLPFLFLSHLHHDHISGLETLFSCVKVDYVFLPYLSPWERLLLAIIAPKFSPWYIDFLRNPVEYLLKKGANVILITNFKKGTDEEEETDIRPIYLEYPPDFPIYLDGLKDLEEKTAENLFEQEGNPDLLKKYYKNGRLRVTGHSPKSSRISQLWEFVLYQAPMSEKAFEDFKGWVLDKIKGIPFLRNNIGSYNSNPLILLSDASLLEELKSLYYKLFEGKDKLNLTSLILWHGPLNSEKRSIRNLKFGYCYDYNAHEIPKKLLLDLCWRNTSCSAVSIAISCLVPIKSKYGQLLTGDLNLKNQCIYNDFKNHFGEKLSSTVIFLVPHHGSKNNWNQKLIHEIKSGEIWIISADQKNNRYPPHKEVITDILYNGKMLFCTGKNADYVISFDAV